jgi:uncharacterized membrane-anchored protein YitT (DUF2179 family)
MLVFQREISPLKFVARLNIAHISTTLLVSQLFHWAPSVVNDEALRNIPFILVTWEKFGRSVALITRLDAPSKACHWLAHQIFVHHYWSTDIILCWLAPDAAVPLNTTFGNQPTTLGVIRIVWSHAVANVQIPFPVTVACSNVPSLLQSIA